MPVAITGTAMVDEETGVTVGCKVPRWQRDLFREVAHRHRTTMSALLRERVEDLIDESDIDRSDLLAEDIEK